MTLRDTLKLARRWSLFCVLAIVLAGASAYFVTKQMSPAYRSSATLLVNQAQTPGVVTYQDILGSQQLTKTYAALATSNINLERAAATLGNGLTARELGSHIHAGPVTGTQLITVSAEHTDPATAALYANTVAREFIGYISEAQLAGTTTAESGALPLNTVFVAAVGTPAASPFKPNMTRNVVFGALAGLLVMGSVIVVVEYLNDRIRGREEIEALGVAFLGGVVRTPSPNRGHRGPWLPIPGQDRGMLESVRQVQANLSFTLAASAAKVVLITSPNASDGKSTVASNLASAIAESSRSVLLVDGDLRKPDAHRYFSIPNTSGLSSAVVAAGSDPKSFVISVSELLSVFTGGPTPPNPTNLISSPRMKEIFENLRGSYDVIVIDSPPLAGIADALHWASLADGIILVARSGSTRQGQMAESLKRIEASPTPLLGIVVNGVQRNKREDYYYSYGSSAKDEPPRPGTGSRSRQQSTPAQAPVPGADARATNAIQNAEQPRTSHRRLALKTIGITLLAASIAISSFSLAAAQYPAPGSAVIITTSNPNPGIGETITLTIQVSSPAAANFQETQGRAILASMPPPPVVERETGDVSQAPPYSCTTSVSGGSGAVVSPSTLNTDASGVASVSLYTGTQAANLVVTVSCGSVSGQAIVPVGQVATGTPGVVPGPPSTGLGTESGSSGTTTWAIAAGFAALAVAGTGAFVVRRSRASVTRP